MAKPFENSPEFRRLLQGDETADLSRIALEIARDAYPDLQAERYLARIESLANRVRDRCPNGARVSQILGQINWVLFLEEKFQGNSDDYYDPRNSYLNKVLDRKVGIPISLSVLYLAVAERLGLVMSGVNLPSHFVLRTGSGTETVFVDPYHAGALLNREGCERRVAEVTGQAVTLTEEQLAPCATTTIVARMLRNLKAVYLQSHNFPDVLPVLRRLTALSRGDVIERRDLGLACLQTNRPGEAIDHLEHYLMAQPGAEDVETIEALLRVARAEVARWN